LRRALVVLTDRSNTTIQLDRTERGRPFPVGEMGARLNVSHAGHLTVLAAEMTAQQSEVTGDEAGRIGVDIMPVTDSRIERTEEFFRLMRNQFTDTEWKTILAEPSDELRLKMFYRHWCLKESYVKAVGTGLNLDLQTIEFKLEHSIQPVQLVTDSQVSVGGSRLADWRFEETEINDHLVAVASNISNRHQLQGWTELQIGDLLPPPEQLLRPKDPTDWTRFQAKEPKKPF